MATQHSVKLIAYDAVDINNISYNNGDVIYDGTNKTLRVMDGVTPGGWSIATESWVNQNALTVSSLAPAVSAALSSQLVNYSTTSQIESTYATLTELATAVAGVVTTIPTAGVGAGGTLGGVRVDGTTITINDQGVISGSNGFTLPQAVPYTSNGGALGGVIPDGTTITINSSGVISGANTYALPAATNSVLGGVIIPAVLTSGITNTSGTIGLATASATQLGGVKIDNTTITINNGVISGYAGYTLPAATTSTLGGVTIPVTANSGFTNTSGTLRLATASTIQLGGVKVDGETIIINSSGVISAQITGAIVFQGGWNANTNTPYLTNGVGTNGFEYVVTTGGTVNFGAGNITFTIGDNVIYNGTIWVRVPIGSSSGTTNYLATFNSSGTGANSPATFNGSAAVTISYNTIGAEPAGGSSDITTVGTVTSGTWAGTAVSPAYGGTGVNNGTYTITVTGANRTFNQDVDSGASPTFTATNFSGTASSLTAGSASTSANITGGVANQVVYQSATGTTGFVSAPTTSNTFLTWTGSGFSWTAGSSGTVTSVTGAGTVSGISLSASGTSSVTLTLGGTLTLSSPPAIGSVAPNTGAFTTLSASQTVSFSPASYNVTLAPTGSGQVIIGGNSSGAVTISPTGSGSLTIAPSTAGTINNMSIGATTASTGRFTTVTSTVATGTAPFTVTSTTNVANLNASSLNGATFASPGAIGSSSASTGAFTTITATTSIKASGTGGVGYNTGGGAGSTVTQLTSRTTGVTINTPTGAITLFSAAGSGTGASFTVTNSSVAATDVVVVNAKSGTNTYLTWITAVATGSFQITFATTGGTATDSPVFSFAVIKGSTN